MDYKKIYDNLIKDALFNPKPDLYKETHHIVPKCMGGSNKKNNLIKLTAKQHYLAHWLLYKIYKTSSLVHAWYCMSRIGVGQEKRLINSRLFDYCKKERNKILSENFKGNKNNFYGKSHTDKTKQKLSEIHSGKNYKSEKQIKQWISEVAKRPSSEIQKKKLSERNRKFITLQNKLTLEKIYIDKNELINYDLSIWVNVKKITPDKKETCIHCGITSTKGNIIRWHNEKCKRKNDEN